MGVKEEYSLEFAVGALGEPRGQEELEPGGFWEPRAGALPTPNPQPHCPLSLHAQLSAHPPVHLSLSS